MSPMSAAAPFAPSDPSATTGDRIWGALVHLSTFVAPFIGPLLIGLVRSGRPFVTGHMKSALEFQLTWWLVAAAATIVCLLTCGLALLAVVPLGAIAWLGSVILTLVGAAQAFEGAAWRYPLSLRVF